MTACIRLTEKYVGLRGEAIDPGRHGMIAGTDTGEGIAPEHLERVYGPDVRNLAP